MTKIISSKIPKVSVIIPNYNHSSYLDKRIRSVLNQSYQDIEIIFLDDASPDNSLEVFSRFSSDPRIRAILNDKNSGSPFKQWNKGVSEAAGEYIWIAESDDFAETTLLETLVEALDQHPSAGVAYCQSYRVSSEGNVLSTFANYTHDLDPERWNHNFFNIGTDECKDYLIYKCTIPNASGVLFRRSVYEEIGKADETKQLCGDWLLWAKMLMHSDVVFIAQPLNYFRQHDKTCRSRLMKLGYLMDEYLDILQLLFLELDLESKIQKKAIAKLFSKWKHYLCTSSPKFRQQLNFYRKIMLLETSLKIKFYIFSKIFQVSFSYLRFNLRLKTRISSLTS